MLTAAYVFLIVAPTPEPQFLPVLLFLVVVARGLAVEEEARAGREGPWLDPVRLAGGERLMVRFANDRRRPGVRLL
jgi:hypothetical protein